MRLLLLVTLIPVSAGAAWAQAPVTANAPEGVTILAFSSRAAARPVDWDLPRDAATSQSVEDLRGLPSRDPNASQAPTPIGILPATRQRDRTNQTKGSKKQAEIPDSPTILPNRRVEYIYEARIKNLAAETITGVVWEYLFLAPGSETPLARHSFLSFPKTEAGKSSKLTSKSSDPPTRVISASGSGDKRKLFEERVVIKCVAYHDGTVRWLATASERDCAEIRNGEKSRRD